jgi:hypothetical protein
MTTSELSINFLRTPTIRSGTLIGRGRLIHATRTLGLSEATIADGHGRLLGHATSRCMLFELPTEMSPAYRHTGGSPDTPDPYLRAVEGDVRGHEFWNSLSGREIMNQIAREGISWRRDPDWGYEIPVAVPGVDLTRYDPRSHYSEAEYAARIDKLRQERREWLARFPGLDPAIPASIGAEK